jgi:L-lactate utilization protein LutC
VTPRERAMALSRRLAECARRRVAAGKPSTLCLDCEDAIVDAFAEMYEHGAATAYEAAAKTCEEYARRLAGLNAWTDAVPAAATGCADAIRALAGKAAT